jgi:TonB family protein
MREAVSAVLELRAPGPAGLSRLVKWSFGLHLGAAAAVIAWQAALTHFSDDATVMTISLSGASGPASGGLTALGGRQVDEVKPEPKRPEPIAAVATKPDEMTVPAKSTAKPPPVRRDAPASTSSVVTPSATGRQVATGTSTVETGTHGMGTGLAQGGGGAVARVDPKFEFCCKDYLGMMRGEISTQVTWKQESHGTTIIRFEVLSNGSIPIESVRVERSSNTPYLDIEARRAVLAAHLPPLPKAYTQTSLIVYVTIPF